jgi:hypothetical protein
MAKKLTVNFYQGHEGPDDPRGEKFLAAFVNISVDQEWLDETSDFGVTCLEKDEHFIFGELKYYRDDAPHIGKPKGKEKELQLEDEEHVIEKVFYLYSVKHRILLMQISAYFHSPNRLAEIVGNNCSSTCYFAPLMRDDALQRATANIADSKKIVCAFAIPSAKVLSPSDDWSKAALTLAEGGTGRMEFSITGDMRGTTKEPLKESLVSSVIRGARSGLLDKAKIYTASNEPIDLLSDRLQSKIEVEMNGRYPQKWSVRNELKRTLQSNEQTLDQY